MTLTQLARHQAPVFLVAFLIAEYFYKFRSFALECLAFLVTWFVLDALVSLIVEFMKRRGRRQQTNP
jgi:biotin transporter BioY